MITRSDVIVPAGASAERLGRGCGSESDNAAGRRLVGTGLGRDKIEITLGGKDDAQR